MITRSRTHSLPDVATCLYEAGVNPAYWPEAAIQVGKYTQSCTTNLMWVERNGRKVIWYTDGLSKESQTIYNTRLYRSDPAYDFALTAPLDTPGVSAKFVPRVENEHTAAYRDLLLRDGVETRARSVVLRTLRHIAFVGIGRRQFRGPFDREALRRLQEISPHLRRSIQVAYRLQSMERRTAPLNEVMDRLEHGVFLVDETLRVSYFNAEARRALRDSGVLSLRKKILAATAPSESATLLRLIHGAIQTVKGEGTESGGSLTLHDKDGHPRLYLDVTPLRADGVSSQGQGTLPRAMVVCRMPDATVALRPETLRQHFRLSPAEARLAIDLAQGDPLKDIAERRGIAFGTVRAQLASIFDKTGVHRQSELVKLLMGVSGGLVEPRRAVGYPMARARAN